MDGATFTDIEESYCRNPLNFLTGLLKLAVNGCSLSRTWMLIQANLEKVQA